MSTLTDYLEQTTQVQSAIDPANNLIIIPFIFFIIVGIVVDLVNSCEKFRFSEVTIYNLDIVNVLTKIYSLIFIFYFLWLYWAFMSYNVNIISPLDDTVIFNSKENSHIPSRSFYSLAFIIFSGLLYWSVKILLIQNRLAKKISLSVLLFTGYTVFSQSVILTGIYYSDLSSEVFLSTHIPLFTNALIEILIFYIVLIAILLPFLGNYVLSIYWDYVKRTD